jgi:glycosyltransferase involved in cell wall biosynthesis
MPGLADAPEVSVVIPTKNRWELLARSALAGALRQEDVSLEVVVVDDGSDAPPPALEGLRDPRVRLVRNERSLGMGGARNAGIREARGEWLAFLDDDDLWSPRKLREQLDAAATRDAVFVYTGILVLDPDGGVLEAIPAPDPDEVGELLQARNVLRAGSSSILARADAVREVEGFDDRLHEIADWDLWLRLVRLGPAAACPEYLAGYVAHPQNARVVGRSDLRDELERFERKHPPPRALASARRAYFSRWLAMGHLRAGRRLRAARVYVASAVSDRSPGNLVRAVAALAGDRAFNVRRRIAAERPQPAWLDLYR